jgi:NAD(P)H-flavin reductase/ferredoxin
VEAHQDNVSLSNRPPAAISIAGGGSFPCLPEETLLTAALRAGYAAPYECASGTCGSCKARLINGAVRRRWAGATGLSERDRRRGDRILCCQSLPTGNCTIQLRAERSNSEPLPKRWLGEVVAIDEMCARIRRIKVHCDRDVAFLPGQFMLLEFPSMIGFRAYSMANEPVGSPELEFIIKAKPGGAGSAHLLGELAFGDVVALEGPYGRAYLRGAPSRPIIAVAGGSGLAPMLSVTRAALKSRGLSVHLFFGIDRASEVFAQQELSDLAAQHADFKLTIAVRESDHESAPYSAGAIGDVMLAECADLSKCDLYMAGPPAMIDSLLAKTVTAGKITANRVFFDRF